MTQHDERGVRAERSLAAVGLTARVRPGGHDGDLAIVSVADVALGQVIGGKRDEIVEICRDAGFRYVALELFDNDDDQNGAYQTGPVRRSDS